MIIADKASFFDLAAPKKEAVEIKDGMEVLVTEMSASDFVAIWTSQEFRVDGDESRIDIRKMTPHLIASSVVDENGARLFEDSDAEDLERRVGTSLFLKLGVVARRLNGITMGEEKNSEASPVEDSSSGSPSN